MEYECPKIAYLSLILKIFEQAYPFSEIENEFLNFSTNYNYICLLGDFNARTAEEPDFVETNYHEFSGA
jgi:hypothetical protein